MQSNWSRTVSWQSGTLDMQSNWSRTVSWQSETLVMQSNWRAGLKLEGKKYSKRICRQRSVPCHSLTSDLNIGCTLIDAICLHLAKTLQQDNRDVGKTGTIGITFSTYFRQRSDLMWNYCFEFLECILWSEPNQMMQNSVIGLQNGRILPQSLKAHQKVWNELLSRDPGTVQWLSRSPGPVQEDKS